MTEVPSEAFELRIAQMILESVRFEHDKDFLRREATHAAPPSTVGVNVETQRSQDENLALVRLRVVSKEPEAVYKYEVVYTAILQYSGPAPADFDHRLSVTGASMLMPFVRELVANLSSRGRFGPTWLAPVNFNNALKRPDAIGDATKSSI